LLFLSQDLFPGCGFFAKSTQVSFLASMDTRTVTSENMWFVPVVAEMIACLTGFHGPADLHALDLFGASERVTTPGKQ